jgi:hypothetical protein
MSDPSVIELAMRVVQQTSAEPLGHDPVVAELPAYMPRPILDLAPIKTIEVENPPTSESLPGSAGLTRTAPVKEKKSADELAAMILDDLSQIEGCPKRGVKVTVYGSNPWNSWLSFGGDAGPVPNRIDLHSFCDFVTERLKPLYDVAP